MSLNYLSSFFQNNKEESSDSDNSIDALSDGEFNDLGTLEEKNDSESSSEIDESEEIDESDKTLNKERNSYKSFQAFASKKYLEKTKPLFENFKFSFKRMMVINGMKEYTLQQSANEWTAAYKIQKWYLNNKKKN